MALISATSVWVALSGPTPGPAGFADAGTRASSPGGAAARVVSLDTAPYGDVVDEMERILEEGRPVLAPETLATIEGSLRTLDAAIADVEEALADDPGSDLLQRLLSSHRSTKLGVLQRAVSAVQART